MIKFDVLNWLSGHVQFTAELDCTDDAQRSLKLGLAVQWAVKNGASLVRARLDGARLVRARLDGARLDGARLVRARLDGARLDGARLDGARLDGASLDGASLDGASLVRARLDGARLDGASLPAFQIPQEGELTVWKKLASGRLARLLIPADAKRTMSLIGRKCRAERVLVLDVFHGKTREAFGIGQHDGKTIYTVNQITTPDSYDGDIRVECTHGIHFFLTREEAEAY